MSTTDKIKLNLLPQANGGTGTATPSIVAGTNVTVSGVWPNQTINAAVASVTVETRAYLRALGPLADGTVVFEKGYLYAGDGGGGEWVVVRGDTTTIDNDGTLVVRSGTYGTTSTDQCYKRLAATWTDYTGSAPAKQQQIVNVRWFGAHASGRYGDCITAVERAFATLPPRTGYGDASAGGLYFPAGEYGFPRMLQLTGNPDVSVQIFGDGAATEFSFRFTTGLNLSTNIAMIRLVNMGFASSLHSFSIRSYGNVWPASIISITGALHMGVHDIVAYNMGHFGTSAPGEAYKPNTPREIAPGGIFFINASQQVTIERLETTGCWGTQLCIGSPGDASSWVSGSVSNCKFQQSPVIIPGAFDVPFWVSGTSYVVGNFSATITSTNPLVTRSWRCVANVTSTTSPVSDPTHWTEGVPSGSMQGVRPTVDIQHSDTLLFSNIFTECGGPYRAFPGSAITGGASFVINTLTPHYFGAGEWVVINGATNAAYNKKHRIASVTSTTITVASSIGTNETNCYVTSLFVAVGLGCGNPASGDNGGLQESKIVDLFTNSGGTKVPGTVSVYAHGRTGPGRGDNTNSGLQINGIFSDYAECACFVHGTPKYNGGAEGLNTCYGVQLGNIQSNGGPEGDFGFIRVETAKVVSINGVMARAATRAYGAGQIPAVAGNWAFDPVPAIVISDGGASNSDTYGCNEVDISGGMLQDAYSSQVSLIAGGPSSSTLLTSTALQIEGTKLRNIRCRGAGIDLISTNSVPLRLLDGATRFVTVGGVYRELVNVDFWQGRTSLIYPSANQSIPDSTGAYLTQFNSQIINDDGFWNTADQDRLTIARPVYRVRISANLTFHAPPGANAFAQIVVAGAVVASQGWGGSAYMSMCSPVVQVLPGQIVQVFVQHFAGTALLILGNSVYTNLSIEVIA
jgi:hypothetical protein